jgi:AraC-like DNA-binding protein
MKDFYEIKYHQEGHDPLNRSEHSHDNCYELIHTVSGDGTVLIRDRIYPLQPGYLYLINARNVHCTNPENAGQYVRSKIIFSEDLGRALIGIMGLESTLLHLLEKKSGGFFPLPVHLPNKADALFRECAAADAEETEHSRAIIITALTGIFLMLVHDAIAAEPEEGNISRVLRYINLHLAEPLSLDVIAKETFLSKYYLCRMFHRETGMTVNQYIAHCRIAKARRALTETTLTVSDISEQCGFNSISYFTQCFREMEGMTPSEYRRKSAKRIPGSPG